MKRTVLLALVAWCASAEAQEIEPILMAQTQYAVHSSEAEGENGFALQRLRVGLMARPTWWFTAAGILEYDRGQQREGLRGLRRSGGGDLVALQRRLPAHAALPHRQGRVPRGIAGP